MTGKSTPKPAPKLTDAERHKRFVDMAKIVEASNDAKDFEAAFETIVRMKSERPLSPRPSKPMK
jgi:hypothetical protein